MRRAILAVVPIVTLGTILGATVFRTDIAQATGLAPAPQQVVVTNTNAQAVPVNVGNAVKIDPANNTVQIGGQPVNVVVAPAPFHVYKFVPPPVSPGGKSCTSFGLSAGTKALLHSVAVTTYTDPAAAAYLRYFVREGAGISRILTQRIPTIDVGSDPVADTRSGHTQWDMHINGGSVLDVQDGEVHSVSACIQSSVGESASGTFMLDGTEE